MSEEKLLPCPFCSSIHIKISPFQPGVADRSSFCYCDNCGTKGPDEDYTATISAVKLWNIRTPSIDWIVNRAVELARSGTVTIRQFRPPIIYNDLKWDKAPEEILEQIKKELGEK